MLLQRFLNQYVTDCSAEPELNFTSDHKLLLTCLTTPKDKRARWRPKSKPTKKPDTKLLLVKERESEYINYCTEEIKKRRNADHSVDEISESLTQVLSTAASKVLPNKSTKEVKQIWKDDENLNQLIEERTGKVRPSVEYITITNQIKSRF